MADQTENGSSFRILTLLDEHTRQCLAIHPAWSIRAVDVITVVEAAIARYGVPEHLRSDNGPEFIAYCIQDWLTANAIKTIYIEPARPWQNGFVESFHGRFRDECLNREQLWTLTEARVVIEDFGCNTTIIGRTPSWITKAPNASQLPNRSIFGSTRLSGSLRRRWNSKANNITNNWVKTVPPTDSKWRIRSRCEDETHSRPIFRASPQRFGQKRAAFIFSSKPNAYPPVPIPS